MANVSEQIQSHFAPPDGSLPQDVLVELLHIAQLMGLSAEDLYYKWDSYVMTMGADTTQLDAKTLREFKKSLQDALERESRKGNMNTTRNDSAAKRMAATPRAGARSSGGDVLGLLDGIVSNTPASASRASMAKRRANFDTPSSSKSLKSGINTSPADGKTRNMPTIAFAERQNAGEVVESINAHLPAAVAPEVPPTEARIKLKAAMDLPKFSYKHMAMKLSEASEVLDDRIDTITALVQDHYKLEDSAFGNPAAQSTAEVVAVGRIACDSSDGKLNASSMVLETSRRMGAGMRVPLKFADDTPFDVFPGKIVALRGTNVGGHGFLASEVLPLPSLPPAASRPSDLEVHNDRLVGADGETRPLNMLIGSGPFTSESDLSFAPLYALLEKAEAEQADLLLLTGPFLDLEHPVVASGDFEPHLPGDAKISPDQATITDIFRILISQPIQKLAAAVPTITIVLVPSLRDAISKHVAWPQDRVPRPQLGLPRQVQFVPNPMALSINEILLGASSQDILSELRRENVHQAAKGAMNSDVMGRLAGHIIEQSHYFPLFPPTAREHLPPPTAIPDEVPEVGGEPRAALGANLDLTYLKMGEFWQAKPDLLILPSVLNPFVKVCFIYYSRFHG